MMLMTDNPTEPIRDHTDAEQHDEAPGVAAHSSPIPAGVALTAAIVLSGLFAGFFLTYSASVQLGLAQVDDLTYVRTFQAINATIRNATFAVMFFGCVPAIGLALWVHRRARQSRPVLLAIGLLSCLAVVVITFAFSVPLNDQLATFVDPTAAEATVARAEFESVWNRWNLARTILSVIGATCVAAASVVGNRGPIHRR